MSTKAQIIDFLLAGYRTKGTDKPLNAGTIDVTVAGTPNVAYVWDDRDKTLPTVTGRSTITLDAYGKAEVYGDGVYKFVIKDSSGTTVETINNAEYKTVFDPQGTVFSVDDMFALSKISGQEDGDIVATIGFFFSAPDPSPKGGNFFEWQDDLSQSLATGGNIFDPTSIGTWDGTKATLNDEYYGPAGQGSGGGTGCWVATDHFDQFSFGATGEGYPTNDGPALNAYAEYCRTSEQPMTLTTSEGPSILYSLEDLDFTGIDVFGSGVGVYNYGSVADGLGFEPLTGIPGPRPSAAAMYNEPLRKPTSGVCILSDLALNIVKISSNQRYDGFGVCGYLGTVGQHGLIDEYDATYKGVRFDFGAIEVRGCGSDGIALQNGIEVTDFASKLRSIQNNGHGLSTAGGGGKDNQEYTNFRFSEFNQNRLDGVLIENFKKSVMFEGCNGTSNGWYGFGVTNSVVKPVNQKEVVGLLRVRGTAVGAQILEINRCFGEDSGRLITIEATNPVGKVKIEGGRMQASLGLVDVDNDMIGLFDGGGPAPQFRELIIENNSNQDDGRGVILTGDITEDNIFSCIFGNGQLTDFDLSEFGETLPAVQTFEQELILEKSAFTGFDNFGDGTANTFTSNFIIDATRDVGQGNNSYPRGVFFLITAAWQATNSNQGGAYLFHAFTGAGGERFGEAAVQGAGAGFTAPPTIAETGVLSIPLAANFRGSITRLDLNGDKA
jgi:hypothetical protein